MKMVMEIIEKTEHENRRNQLDVKKLPANKESGAGSANAEGVQYVDAGNKLEWRVKNTVGNDYN